MLLTLCKGKLHRATVTQAERHYTVREVLTPSQTDDLARHPELAEE